MFFFFFFFFFFLRSYKCDRSFCNNLCCHKITPRHDLDSEKYTTVRIQFTPRVMEIKIFIRKLHFFFPPPLRHPARRVRTYVQYGSMFLEKHVPKFSMLNTSRGFMYGCCTLT
jgi:hypothetical protein